MFEYRRRTLYRSALTAAVKGNLQKVVIARRKSKAQVELIVNHANNAAKITLVHLQLTCQLVQNRCFAVLCLRALQILRLI